MKPAASLPVGYFDDVYRAADDPWRFETSPYEAAKYRATVAALGERRFRRGFEIGCSIGVLSERLAPHCDALLSVDISETPLARARQRCRRFGQVAFEKMNVPDEFPGGAFELVVMSEVGYYWSRADLARAIDRTEGALASGGLWLLVHWTPEVAGYPLRGDEVHDAVAAHAAAGGPLTHLGGQRQETYRLDLFTKRAAFRGA